MSGHIGDSTVVGLSVVNGRHPPYPSVSHPSAHEILTFTGRQFPFPSLVYPLGQTIGSGCNPEVIERQFPFPSVSYPDAQTIGIYLETQFPYPSESKPDGHVGIEG